MAELARIRRASARSYGGFTLMELLVVISVIAILGGLLIPVLGAAKERARRVVCQSNVRQFIMGTHLYAADHRQRLPSGLSDIGDEHTPVISTATRDALVEVIGDNRVLMCPWLGEPFTDPDGWYHHYGRGYVLGYNYLGGHVGTPWPMVCEANAEWKSPQLMTDRGSMPVVTELNAWSRGEGRTFAPHGPRGAILAYQGQRRRSRGGGGGGIPSEQVGATGGNVGLLDGSVSWKQMADMKIYRCSRDYTRRGCFASW